MSPVGKILCSLLPLLAALPAVRAQGDPFCLGHPGMPRLISGEASCIYDSASGDTSISLDSPSVIHWNRFKVRSGSTLSFSNNHAVVNRVTSASQATVDGLLTSSGHLVLLNPHGGIRVGSGGVVQAPSFTASTLASHSDLDFLKASSPVDLTAGSGSGVITISGDIRALAGDVVLAGSAVVNDGQIIATGGSVHIGSGDALIYDPASKDRRFRPTANSTSTVTNLGNIEGSEVELTANANLTNAGRLAASAPRGRVFLRVDPATGSIDLEPSGLVAGTIVTSTNAGTGTQIDPSDGSNRTTRTSGITRFPSLRNPGSPNQTNTQVVVTRTAVAALSSTTSPAVSEKHTPGRRKKLTPGGNTPVIASRGTPAKPRGKSILRRSSFFGVRSTPAKKQR